MKFLKFAKAASLIMAFLGIAEIPIADGKVNFDDDQKAKLQEELEAAQFDKIVEAFNKEIAENAKVKGIKAEIDSLLETTNLTEEEIKQLARGDLSDDDPDADDKALEENIKLLKLKMQEKDAMILALVNDAEIDIPEHKIKGAMLKEAIKHSATHLFGSNKAIDAFEDRNWNQKAAGLVTTATDFSDGSTIDKLNGDLTLFYRENPEKLESLHRDNFGLPSNWSKRTKVDDRVADGSIATAEISQARKLPWLPKNKQLIKPEEGKVFPISIDIEFVGHLLSVIEASWLNSYNKEGSQAYKWTFIRFLVNELDKKARQEDRTATIKGVHVETPDDATIPGKYINRQNGLLYAAYKGRDIDKKYRAFDIGMPTTSNIVDYIESLIKSLPIEVRETQGLELQLAPYWFKAYRKRMRELHGMENDWKGEPTYPKDYPNILFQTLVDMEGLDFMLVTYSNNIEILENIPAEKSMYKFETLKRIVYIFADYKMGIRFKHIGNKVADGDPDEFKVQTVWSNTAPIFASDFYIPVNDDTTGEVVVTFDRLQVADNWATDITKFTGAVPGTILRIQGNTNMPATKNVVDNADTGLVSNFPLKSGGILTLYVEADGKTTEISRTIVPPSAVEDQATYDTATVDAEFGSVFLSDHSATTAITGVVNGTPGKHIVLYGTDAADVNVTFSTTGNIKVASAATLADSADSIELVLVDGVWNEVKRTIA